MFVYQYVRRSGRMVELPWVLWRLLPRGRRRRVQQLCVWCVATADRLQQRREFELLSREGMATVWDSEGRYLGCIGVETWQRQVSK